MRKVSEQACAGTWQVAGVAATAMTRWLELGIHAGTEPGRSDQGRLPTTTTVRAAWGLDAPAWPRGQAATTFPPAHPGTLTAGADRAAIRSAVVMDEDVEPAARYLRAVVGAKLAERNRA